MKFGKELENSMLRNLFYYLCPDLLGKIYFRFGIRLVPESSEDEIDTKRIKRICVLATSEAEEFVPITPMLRALRRAIPDGKIILATASELTEDSVDDTLVDKVFVIDSTNKGKVYRQIRKEWPDLTIAAIRQGYTSAKEAFCTGARYRIGFRYDHNSRKSTSFFYTHAVPFQPDKHEEKQYLDLLTPLGL